MTAHELADKLQMDKARALLYVDTVVEAANMLRLQAERIKELEAKYKQEFEYAENLLKERKK